MPQTRKWNDEAVKCRQNINKTSYPAIHPTALPHPLNFGKHTGSIIRIWWSLLQPKGSREIRNILKSATHPPLSRLFRVESGKGDQLPVNPPPRTWMSHPSRLLMSMTFSSFCRAPSSLMWPNFWILVLFPDNFSSGFLPKFELSPERPWQPIVAARCSFLRKSGPFVRGPSTLEKDLFILIHTTWKVGLRSTQFCDG